MTGHASDLYQAVLRGDSGGAETAAHDALAAGVDLTPLMTGGVFAAMREVRRRYQIHEYFVPELLLACRAMRAAMSQFRPRLAAGGFQPTAQVSVISLTHEPEDMTGWLVADLLEGDGFDVGRSTLASGAGGPGERGRLAEATVVVLVAPTFAFWRGSACLPLSVTDAVEELRRHATDWRPKIVLVGPNVCRSQAAHIDAVLDELGGVVPAVERLAQDARQLSSGEGKVGRGAGIA